MRTIVTVSSYGTRLEKDILEDKSGKYQHLLGSARANASRYTTLSSDMHSLRHLDSLGCFCSVCLRVCSLPKPLVPVDGRPLISHWLELAVSAGLQPNDFYIITNQHFHAQFTQWAHSNKVMLRTHTPQFVHIHTDKLSRRTCAHVFGCGESLRGVWSWDCDCAFRFLLRIS